MKVLLIFLLLFSVLSCKQMNDVHSKEFDFCNYEEQVPYAKVTKLVGVLHKGPGQTQLPVLLWLDPFQEDKIKFYSRNIGSGFCLCGVPSSFSLGDTVEISGDAYVPPSSLIINPDIAVDRDCHSLKVNHIRLVGQSK